MGQKLAEIYTPRGMEALRMLFSFFFNVYLLNLKRPVPK